jgi:hypothetical protein
MAHIDTRGVMPDISDLTRKMLEAAKGHQVSDVAQAGLDICLGLWAASGDVTREMALMVVTSQIESRFKDRSN